MLNLKCLFTLKPIVEWLFSTYAEIGIDFYYKQYIFHQIYDKLVIKVLILTF